MNDIPITVNKIVRINSLPRNGKMSIGLGSSRSYIEPISEHRIAL